MKREHFSTFFTTWFILLVLNQSFIFGCFAPYCILAGLLPTGIVAFFVAPFFVGEASNSSEKKKSTLEKAADVTENLAKVTADLDSAISKWGNDTLKELEEESIKKAAEREKRINQEIIKANAILDELKSKQVKKKNSPFSDMHKIFDNLENDLNPQTIMSKAKSEVSRKKTEETIIATQDEKTSKKYEASSDPLKQWGDKYEKFIGRQFENKGELVIYNGFIRGYEDDGVDIIVISSQTKTIHLIQCKNWTKKPLLLSDVEKIYKKLQNFSLTRITQSEAAIKEHLEIDKSLKSIKDILRVNKSDYSLRRTLYVGSDKVVDLNIGKHLKLIKPSIFKYEDMKIVIKKMA
ncbi:MAG: hypothetical protein U9N59_09945 [Campylobacterota bacterium]|nr:hypothetical protein [Campylobacterota bacterium]